jgi:ectoine hydroxylase-related dioxygenase (phytanoyl-CoA dioxygenase family)
MLTGAVYGSGVEKPGPMAGHPTFTPDQKEQALDFFVDQNYVVVSDALPPENIDVLRAFVDRSESEIPGEWGPDKLGSRSHAQILVYHSELDEHVRPAVAWGLVDEIMGPDTRFAQFDFRDLWEGATQGQPMRWHKDRQYAPRVHGDANPPGYGDPGTPRVETDPNTRYDCTYVCAIHYLTDVGEDQPCFGLVPNSHQYDNLDEAKAKMGDDFTIIPIRGPAGTVVLYNIAIQHTRMPGEGRRLTQHNYFSRAQSVPLTNWVMLPRRLAEHADAEVRTFYSQWTDATKAFAKAEYSDAHYEATMMDKPT